MTCTTEQRRQLQRVATIVETRATVLEATVLAPAAGQTDRWELDIELDDQTAGADAGLLTTLGFHGLVLRDCSPQGECWRVLAVLA